MCTATTFNSLARISLLQLFKAVLFNFRIKGTLGCKDQKYNLQKYLLIIASSIIRILGQNYGKKGKK